MRWLTALLLALLVLVQYPLWIGKGGWLRVREATQQLKLHQASNQKLDLRNAAMIAEVTDLKQGYDAIEERARHELGMIKEGEVFVQIPEKTSLSAASQPMPATEPTKKTDQPADKPPRKKPPVKNPSQTATPITPSASKRHTTNDE